MVRAFLLVLGICVAALVVDFDQPLVRNSLVYARAAEHVIASGYDPRPVVADSRQSYDKPIAFAWFAAPLVAWFGNHHGLMLASALGVVAMLVAVAAFLGTVLPGAHRARTRARAFLLATSSPLVVYQTWSAHPDAIETALVLFAFALAARIVDEPAVAPRRRALLLFVLLEAGVLFKHYGLVLLLALPVAFGRRALGAWRGGARAAVLGLGAAWLGTAACALLALLELHPLHRLVGEGGGAGQYGRGELLASAGGTLLALALALVLCLQAALPFALRCRPRADGLGPALAFAAVYVAGLLPFANAYYNLRYFLPVLPVAGACAALGLQRAAVHTRRAATATFVAVAIATIAVFDVAPVHALVEPLLPQWQLRGPAMPGMLDNLRLAQHREQRAWLARVHAAAPPGATVYFVDFHYYGDAQHGVYERGGQLRADLVTRYVDRAAFEPAEPVCYVCFGRRPDAALLERCGDVSEPQRGVYRVQRR